MRDQVGDLTTGVALLAAWIDEDMTMVDSIATTTAPGDLVVQLVALALQLGEQTAGDRAALRVALRDALTRDIR